MHITCRPLSTPLSNDLSRVRDGFRSATPIRLGQAWRNTPERGFAPGVVRTGWRGDSLLVFADLTDRDVVTQAKRHNDRFWELGDTFEIFLQPEGQPGYVELHVTPNNLRLQLRFERPPSPDDPDSFAKALINRQVFDSKTWPNPSAPGWSVLSEIPMDRLFGVRLAGSHWRFSTGRYDAARSRELPVISSSSRHTLPAFHRPDEWDWLHVLS
jgi:hypothetical protein